MFLTNEGVKMNDPWEYLEELEEKGFLKLSNEFNKRMCVYDICMSCKDMHSDEHYELFSYIRDYLDKCFDLSILECGRVKAWRLFEEIPEDNMKKRLMTKAMICLFDIWENEYQVYDSISFCMEHCDKVTEERNRKEFNIILSKYFESNG